MFRHSAGDQVSWSGQSGSREPNAFIAWDFAAADINIKMVLRLISLKKNLKIMHFY